MRPFLSFFFRFVHDMRENAIEIYYFILKYTKSIPGHSLFLMVAAIILFCLFIYFF